MTDADHHALILSALLRIQDAIGKYLDPVYLMDKEQFIDAVLEAGDDRLVVEAVRALEGMNGRG